MAYGRQQTKKTEPRDLLLRDSVRKMVMYEKWCSLDEVEFDIGGLERVE